MANVRQVLTRNDPEGAGSSNGSLTDYRGTPLEQLLPGTYGSFDATAFDGYVFDHWSFNPLAERSPGPSQKGYYPWWPGYGVDVAATAHFRKVDQQTHSTLSVTVVPSGAGDATPRGTTYPARGSSVAIRAIETDPVNHPFERLAVTKNSGTSYFAKKEITIVMDDSIVFVIAYFRGDEKHGILYSPKNNGRIICSKTGGEPIYV